MRLFKLAGLAGLSAASPTKPDSSEVSAGSNTFSDSLRVDCYPENDADEMKCAARGCTWQPGERGSPWCFYPENYRHYNMISSSEAEVDQNGKMVPTKYFNLSRDPQAVFIPEYLQQIENLQVQVSFETNEAVRIKIVDADNDKRYEVPVPVDTPPGVATDMDKDSERIARLYDIETNESPFWIKVVRRETGQVVFDTSAGPILFYNQFLQLTTHRPTEYIYGFGETEHLNFKYDTDWHTQGMWARDNGVGPDSNLYGVQPYHIGMEDDGKATGILFFNSNAQEVAVSPAPHITYRTIGGVLDFFVFLGPSVEDVTKEYTSFLGKSPMFPYWSLGFQLCRYGYNSLEAVQQVVEENRAFGIPYDVQYGDIDYMERQLDFTIDPKNFDGLTDFVHKIRTEYNMRYIAILDPALSMDEAGEQAWMDPISGEAYPSFYRGEDLDVYIRGEDGEYERGKVWPYQPGVYLDDIVQDDGGWDDNIGRFHSDVVFPDFFKNETYDWWKEEMEIFRHSMYPEGKYETRGLEYDGIWIDMNEPASFTAGRPGPDGFNQWQEGCPRDENNLNHPPFIPPSLNEAKNGVGLFEKTICMNSFQKNPMTGENVYHYDVHSLYGYSEGEPTLRACEEVTGKRCIVVSRSTFPGVQRSIGHWLGDNTSMWRHVKQSMIGTMEFSLFGFSYIGPDTCGFFNDATEEMCQRWMQVGSFFVYSRNHNGITFRRQDPAAWGPKFANSVKTHLMDRYRMLPYLYTLMYKAHDDGSTVVRSMLANFPEDKETWTIDEQMMWGNGLLIAPVVTENTFTKNVYFPDQRWYNYYNGTEHGVRGGWEEVSAPIDYLPLYLRGGEIIPLQKPAQTTMDSRMNGLGLLISLDDDMEASGQMYWDEGDSIAPVENGKYSLIKFNFEKGHLKSEVVMSEIITETHENSGETVDLKFTHFEINGLGGTVTSVVVNGQDLSASNWQQNRNGRLEILNVNDGLPMGEQFDIFIEINNENQRTDCMPGGGDSEACEKKGCVWSESRNPGVPWCFYSSQGTRHYGYRSNTAHEVMTGNEKDISLENANQDGSYSSPIMNAQFQVRRINERQARFKLIDADSTRYEIPEEAIDYANTGGNQASNAFDIVTGEESNRFGFKIEKDGKELLNSHHGPIIMENQFIELNLAIGSYNCYGLGEHNHRRFRHIFNWQKWAMFTRDVAPIDEWNFYGQHPFIMCVEDDFAFGIYMHNSNAQEFILSPNPAITWRSIGGVVDMTFFLTDTPEEMVQLYTDTIGKPIFPPRWSLGFQLSRWGYDTLEKMEQVVEEMFDAKIPYDAQYGDIDYMDRKRDFTYDPVNFATLPEFIQDLHDRGMHYITILDPALQNKLDWDSEENFSKEEYESFWNGDQQENFNGEKGIWIRDENGVPVQAEVWPGPTYFPDFTDVENTKAWWKHECQVLHDDTGIAYDALWIDMNEPANFQTDNGALVCTGDLNLPPYTPNILNADEGLYIKTICMENKQKWGDHYDVHSLYGHSMAIVTYETLDELFPDRRTFVLTRSQFAGTNKYAGHWLGDNQSFWSNMGWSIIGMLEYSLFGFSYTGADICGFWFNATETMCSRWSQLGAFYPYSRNHNGITWRDQHPAAFGSDSIVAESARRALTTRYTLLPTLYTLMYESHADGSTTVRSLMAEFQSDRNSRDNYNQFLWGRGLMIAPIMEEYAKSRGVYFPPGRWFDYYDNTEIAGGRSRLIRPDDEFTIPLFVREGTFLPEQEPELTTTEQQLNPITLKVFYQDGMSGSLFWDDGISQLGSGEFIYMNYSLSGTTLTAACADNVSCDRADDFNVALNEIQIIGKEITGATLGGTALIVNGNNISLDGVKIGDVWSIELQYAA